MPPVKHHYYKTYLGVGKKLSADLPHHTVYSYCHYLTEKRLGRAIGNRNIM